MSEPTFDEVRQWARGLGLPISGRGALPRGLVERWNREHPDRPFADDRGSHKNTKLGLIHGWDDEDLMAQRRLRGGSATARRHEPGGAR